jgi:hypothetical protein
VRSRRLFGAALWLVTTAAATAMVWAATSVVAADVTDRPAPVVAHRDVVNALTGSAAGIAAPAVTTSLPNGPTTLPTTPAAGPPPVTGPGRTPVQTFPPSTAPLPFPTVTTATTVKPASPTTRPGPTTTPAPQVTATYATEGGVVTVACTGPSTIRLVSASPADGFLVFVVSGGPQYVGVDFHSATADVSVGAVCFFGQPFRTNTQGRPPGG